MAGSLRKVDDGVWDLRVSLGKDLATGKYRQRSERFRGTEPQARKALARLVTEVEDGKHTSSGSTFGALLDVWLERQARRRELTTMREYRRIVETKLKPALGSKPLRKLTPKDFDDLYEALQDAGLSPSSVVGVHATARAALNQAVRWGWLTVNPAKLAEPPEVRRKPVAPPSVAQLQAIVAEASRRDPDMATLLVVASLIGARRGELCGLRWGDVDVARRNIRVRTAVVDVAGHVHVKDTKTHQERDVEMDDLVVALLGGLREQLDVRAADVGVELGPESFVFSRAGDGSTPLRPEWVTGAFRRAAKAVGVKAHLHELRHLNASLLLAAGVPLAEVSARLGHAKQSTTSDIYSHMVPGQQRAAPAVLRELLGSTAELLQAPGEETA